MTRVFAPKTLKRKGFLGSDRRRRRVERSAGMSDAKFSVQLCLNLLMEFPDEKSWHEL